MMAGRTSLTSPLLRAAHFLMVCILVSLARLWRQHEAWLLGQSAVEGGMAATATPAFATAMSGFTLAATRIHGLRERVGTGIGIFFVAPALMMGSPTPMAQAC